MFRNFWGVKSRLAEGLFGLFAVSVFSLVLIEPTFAATATRILAPTTYTPGNAVSVSITITPNPTTLAYGIEETPPLNWAITNINNSGVISAGIIKWGVFTDNVTRTFTYTATPPASETGTKTFSGSASFDGSSLAIGPTNIS